jgi:hypothetical protein
LFCGDDSKDRRRFFMMAFMQSPPPLPQDDSDRPRPVPPPLSYVSSREVEWEAVVSFPTVGQWHRANRILSRHGIVARMRMGTGENTEVQLLVLQTEAEWARDLIAGGDESPAVLRKRGFPLDEPAAIAPVAQDQLRAVPVRSEGLSEAQRGRYTIIIIVLWVFFAIILVLMFLSLVAA